MAARWGHRALPRGFMERERHARIVLGDGCDCFRLCQFHDWRRGQVLRSKIAECWVWSARKRGSRKFHPTQILRGGTRSPEPSLAEERRADHCVEKVPGRGRRRAHSRIAGTAVAAEVTRRKFASGPKSASLPRQLRVFELALRSPDAAVSRHNDGQRPWKRCCANAD